MGHPDSGVAHFFNAKNTSATPNFGVALAVQYFWSGNLPQYYFATTQ